MERITNHLIFQRRYEVLTGQEVAQIIEKAFEPDCPLTTEQKDRIHREFANEGIYGNLGLPFQAYRWGAKPQTSSLLQRLLIPVVMILIIVMGLTVCPVKWLLTGRYMIDANSKVFRWVHNFIIWVLEEKY